MGLEAYECTLSGVLAGQFVQTVIHARYNNTSNQPPFFAAKDFAEKLSAASGWVANMMACLPESYEATSFRVRRVGPTGGPTAIVLKSGMETSQGDRGAEISSAQVNPLIIIIPTTAPSKTGRIFMPGVAENDISDMVLSTGLVTEYQNLITYMVNGETTAGGSWEFGILRRTTKLVDKMDAGYISPLIGTQRRRLRPV